MNEAKSVTLGLVVSWLAGVILVLASMGMMTSSVIGGLLLLIAAAILLPPIYSLISEKLGVNVSGGLRAVLVIILVAVAGGMAAASAKEDMLRKVMNEDGAGIAARDEDAAASAAREWVKVAELTASANKQSETFTLKGGQQRISYSVTGGDFSMCSIYVMHEGQDLMEDGGIPTVMADGAGRDETLMRRSGGDYYLDVKVANGTCAVEVYEYR